MKSKSILRYMSFALIHANASIDKVVAPIEAPTSDRHLYQKHVDEFLDDLMEYAQSNQVRTSIKLSSSLTRVKEILEEIQMESTQTTDASLQNLKLTFIFKLKNGGRIHNYTAQRSVNDQMAKKLTQLLQLHNIKVTNKSFDLTAFAISIAFFFVVFLVILTISEYLISLRDSKREDLISTKPEDLLSKYKDIFSEFSRYENGPFGRDDDINEGEVIDFKDKTKEEITEMYNSKLQLLDYTNLYSKATQDTMKKTLRDLSTTSTHGYAGGSKNILIMAGPEGTGKSASINAIPEYIALYNAIHQKPVVVHKFQVDGNEFGDIVYKNIGVGKFTRFADNIKAQVDKYREAREEAIKKGETNPREEIFCIVIDEGDSLIASIDRNSNYNTSEYSQVTRQKMLNFMDEINGAHTKSNKYSAIKLLISTNMKQDKIEETYRRRTHIVDAIPLPTNTNITNALANTIHTGLLEHDPFNTLFKSRGNFSRFAPVVKAIKNHYQKKLKNEIKRFVLESTMKYSHINNEIIQKAIKVLEAPELDLSNKDIQQVIDYMNLHSKAYPYYLKISSIRTFLGKLADNFINRLLELKTPNKAPVKSKQPKEISYADTKLNPQKYEDIAKIFAAFMSTNDYEELYKAFLSDATNTKKAEAILQEEIDKFAQYIQDLGLADL